MNYYLIKAIVKLLRETADKIDAGNCEMNDEDAMEVMSILSHKVMSKEEVCEYLNMSRSKFDELVRMKKMPKGRKRKGFNELSWYKDEIDACRKLIA